MCESASSLMPPSPSPEYKHFCRVCNKGFTCGSALGGHMRAHGASDVDAFGNADDDGGGDDRPAAAGARSSDDGRQWDAAAGTSAATHAYALRANPNRLIRSCQVCKNCGKEFTSWELFLEHGRCNSDDDEDKAEYDGSSSPPSDVDGDDDPAVAAAGGGWSKGKRSRRVKMMNAAAGDVVADVPASAPSSRRCASGEEEDLANCLVMLSSSNVELAAAAAATGATGTSHQQQPSSASKEGDRGPPQLLQPISFLAPAPEPVMALPSATQYVSPAPRGLFECKACKKVFTSHQALGGHRASHKKVKGCFAARFDSNVSETPSHADPNNDNGKAAAVDAAASTADANKASVHGSSADGDANAGTSETAATLSLALAPAVHEPSPPVAAPFPVVASAAAPSSSKKNTKMHECSVCHRLFTSGQALGGHKRCHWLTTSSSADPANPVANLTVPPLTEDLVGVVRHQLMLRPLAADPPEPALDLTIAHPVARAAADQPGTSSFHHLDAPPPVLHFQSPVVLDTTSLRNRTSTTSGHDGATASAAAAEDEADSTVVKRARLSDLKAVVSMDGEAPEPWLKVGIGSSSAGGDDDKNTRE
ncbi:hypothetical protein EJB05_53118 [Eragrostis curvula]|uniref:C2H2-type domain-containing protein n=1 Tax=Eragrostis curvula TaxID=38414 RepID=A0A5J9SQY6_9POAL|nr:hypothetical protein EJB05_53118 [Eragrostis curvula]